MTPSSTRKFLTISIAALCGVGFAQAQEPPADRTSQPTQWSTQATLPIEDKKVEQFADAYVAVQRIQAESVAKVEDATDPAKQKEARAAVENEMIVAVEKTGLKIEEFNGIVQSMTADENLRARVVAEIRERTGG